MIHLSQYDEPPIHLDFPMKNGWYYVVQGGGDITINHHYNVLAQKYALDIVKINKTRFRSSKINPKELKDYYIFNKPLYCPSDGKILEAVDSFDDLIPPQSDPIHPGGNYVIIKAKNSNGIIILAHLKRGSLLVSKDMEVFKGQELARVGNSGNTSEPHLHIHCLLEGTGDFFFTGKGIPMIFDHKILVRNDIFID